MAGESDFDNLAGAEIFRTALGHSRTSAAFDCVRLHQSGQSVMRCVVSWRSAMLVEQYGA
jgi:hypothetical protein